MSSDIFNYFFMKRNGTGYLRDVHDDRDFKIKFSTPLSIDYPDIVDLRRFSPIVFDQQSLNSCTASAVALIYDWIHNRIYNNDMNSRAFIPSRLFLYYNTRVISNNNYKDSGSSIRDTIKTIATIGICPESLWPYKINKFNVKPHGACYVSAKFNKTVQYLRVNQTSDQIERCLAISKNPIVFGINIYDSWYDNKDLRKSGRIHMPLPNEKLIGGHAMVIVGFNKKDKYFIVQNSWGKSWGDKGFCYIPYDYILDRKYAWDFWVIQITSFQKLHV